MYKYLAYETTQILRGSPRFSKINIEAQGSLWVEIIREGTRKAVTFEWHRNEQVRVLQVRMGGGSKECILRIKIVLLENTLL